MNEQSGTAGSVPPRTWLERIGLALLGGEAKSREDLVAELRAARSNGVLDQETLTMLEGALGVVDLNVSDVMVPRGQMVSVDLDQSFEEILNIAIESGHSRFPVFGDSEEKVIGILLAKDLLRCVADRSKSILQLLRPARLVPESKRLNHLLRDFKSSRAHMAIVVNEYGGIAGLVTIEDVLEEIVGPIDDEHDAEDKPVTYFEILGDGSTLVQALTPIAEFNEYFEESLSDEEIDTIGGWVVHKLGRLAETGDVVELERLRLEVSHADDRRLHALKVMRL
jgi:magnesium and cobalt transporter